VYYFLFGESLHDIATEPSTELSDTEKKGIAVGISSLACAVPEIKLTDFANATSSFIATTTALFVQS
jgi:hypothetical protein